MKVQFSLQTGGLVAALVLLLGGYPAQATTNVAASVSFADVSAAINNSAPGDTVIIPPGTAAWNAPMTLAGVSLLGSGTNQTIITDNLDRNANPQSPLIFLHTSTNYFEIGNFQLVPGNTTKNWHGILASDMTGPCRIHHIFFNQVNDKNIMLYAANHTLIDHCCFYLSANEGVLVHDVGYGDASWASPMIYGQQNVPCIEDCVFTNVLTSPSSAALDAEAGARVLFRYNTVLNNLWANHGTESGARLRGCRSFEIYSNTFATDPTWSFPYAMSIRSGSGVIFGNTVTGVKYLTGIVNYRNGERFDPWGGADGYSPWDNVLATNVISGTHTGPNNVTYLQVNNANWTVNQWVGYTVVNFDFSGTNWNFSTVYSNNATQIYFNPAKDYGYMTFSGGQRFQLNQIYPMLDQPGVGSGDLIVGDQQPWGPNPTVAGFGVPKWPRQVSDPIYAWGNSLNGAPGTIGSDFPNVKEGREFFNDIPKPGYQPLQYPHPLQGTGSVVVGGGGSGNSLQPPARVWVQQ